MQRFRYDTTGTWYKGNTHIHTIASDGGKTPAEAAEMYATAGYDFLFRTDHWVASDVAGEDGADGSLLWIDGIEIEGLDGVGGYYHVACLGTCRDIEKEMGFVAALESARSQNAILILAHPYWMGNTIEESLRYEFHGVEIYNHICQWLNGKGCSAYVWDAMLRQRPETLGFACDDAHITAVHPGWDGGWIMVNAAERTPEALLNAIRAGNYYSSCGPDFYSIEQVGNGLRVRTSPASFVRLVGHAYQGSRVGSFDGESTTEAELELPPEWTYARLEIEDSERRCAWTNLLFTSVE